MFGKLKLLFLQLACVAIGLANSYQTPVQNISVVTRVITVPVGYVHYPSIRAAWKLHSETKNWSDAQKACVAEGGRLAIVDTQEKVGYVKSITSRNYAVWVGIKKRNSNWTTADTKARLSGLPWASGQPEGVGDCVAVQKNGKGLYNRLCMWSQRFICEIPIDTTVYQMPCVRH